MRRAAVAFGGSACRLPACPLVTSSVACARCEPDCRPCGRCVALRLASQKRPRRDDRHSVRRNAPLRRSLHRNARTRSWLAASPCDGCVLSPDCEPECRDGHCLHLTGGSNHSSKSYRTTCRTGPGAEVGAAPPRRADAAAAPALGRPRCVVKLAVPAAAEPGCSPSPRGTGPRLRPPTPSTPNTQLRQ